MISNFLKTTLYMALLITSSANAIIIRHDIDDEKYLALGEQYTLSIAYIGGCAATLIDANWILTAAHCLKGKEEEELFFATHVDTQYRVDKIFIHPEFDRKNDVIYDVALVQLKDAIETGKPALLYHRKNEVGLPVIFVGRGTYGNGKEGLIQDDHKQRGATNTVDKVNEYVVGFTFNDPEMASKYEGISSRGDSGGPAFVELDNQLYVIGVSSYQEGDGFKEGHYGVGEYYTRVSSVHPWLKNVINSTPPPVIPRHAIIDAVKDSDLKTLNSSVSNQVLENKDVLQEAFYQSVILGRPELAEALIKKGADFEKVIINNVSLFDFALHQNQKEYFRMLQRLTFKRSNVYHPDSAVLPLFISLFRNDPYLLEGTQLLISQGANLDSQTSSGDTALVVAGWNTSNFELTKLLVSSGANVNIPNNNGDTPLMDAAYLGKTDNLKYLIDNGADRTLKNNRGKTALQLSEMKSNKKAVDLLLDHE